MEWALMPYRRYFDFSGRSRRKEYWLFAAFIFVVEVVLQALFISGGNPFTGVSPLFWLVLVLLCLFVLASFIPSLAVSVRRLHDQDRSGWFLLLLLIPFLGGLIILAMMCLPGTHGPNRFGADPLGPDAGAVFS